MSKKILVDEFLNRFYRNYPESKIIPVNYTAISNPLKIRCGICGKEYQKPRAREFLNSFHCCGANNEARADKLKRIYFQSDDFDFVKSVDRNYFIVHHNRCGNDMKRTYSAAMDNPFACKYCNTIKEGNMLDIKEVQNQLNIKFGNEIQILDYNGQLKKNHYKCLKCGLIFVQQHTCLLQSRGCPKCNRFKSNGERQLKRILEENKAIFKEQVNVSELPLQRFDFGVYDDSGNLKYYIEVQGEQHFEEREVFRDSLKKIQERDNKKREYCKKNNIPLYELIYKKGRIKNLDILPLNSTTISVKESTL